MESGVHYTCNTRNFARAASSTELPFIFVNLQALTTADDNILQLDNDR